MLQEVVATRYRTCEVNIDGVSFSVDHGANSATIDRDGNGPQAISISGIIAVCMAAWPHGTIRRVACAF